ncbi:TetR/AcrR family transcriptional regulator [Paenibacillus sp. SC116]|uniref:TetR/AcrR family transcriptional regulator n=1 Tax=Paenibacillus sp. SC116 TaxID=2968986 RepID=UPI00215AECC1|nr:TetR/AcrR family transcriptional regulator [Paenibacillus sp. SC116]MCR8842289.1 TetR/AcrR family transcriptional regulator [Paenibacillus sp. SC116]
MSNARSVAKENRLNAILDAATEILVNKPTASMNDIADFAGIGIATLHRYVENREQLFVQLALRSIKVVGEILSHISKDDEHIETYIPTVVEELIPYGDKIHFLIQDHQFFCNEEILEAEARILEPIKEVIETLQQRGSIRQDMSSEWILNVFYSILILTWQQVQSGHVAKRSAAKLVIDTLFHGVKAAVPTQ